MRMDSDSENMKNTIFLICTVLILFEGVAFYQATQTGNDFLTQKEIKFADDAGTLLTFKAVHYMFHYLPPSL